VPIRTIARTGQLTTRQHAYLAAAHRIASRGEWPEDAAVAVELCVAAATVKGFRLAITAAGYPWPEPPDPPEPGTREQYRDSLPHAVKVRKLVIRLRSLRTRRAIGDWDRQPYTPKVHREHSRRPRLILS
jgi:hypothetical protein